jgi:hypothetical protein
MRYLVLTFHAFDCVVDTVTFKCNQSDMQTPSSL